MKYHSKNTVRMYDTDAAGILYFARQFRFSHDAWEQMLTDEGFGVDHLFGESSWTMVMVHCEADYKKPLTVGDQLDIYLFLEKIGTTSFTIGYEIFRGEELVGTCRSVQVTLAKKGCLPIPVPQQLAKALGKYTCP